MMDSEQHLLIALREHKPTLTDNNIFSIDIEDKGEAPD